MFKRVEIQNSKRTFRKYFLDLQNRLSGNLYNVLLHVCDNNIGKAATEEDDNILEYARICWCMPCDNIGSIIPDKYVEKILDIWELLPEFTFGQLIISVSEVIKYDCDIKKLSNKELYELILSLHKSFIARKIDFLGYDLTILK